MGGVNDGQPVNASTTNAAFIEKNADDVTPNNLGLASTNPIYGSSVSSTQQFLNAVSNFLGVALSAAYSALPSWATNNRGLAGNNVFQRVESIDTAFDPTTGHKHTGAAGDAPQISLSSGVTGTLPNSLTTATSSPTASTIASRDANANSQFNNAIDGLTSTATAAGTTTLTVASTYGQQLTGSTTQTIVLPVVSTLVVGQAFSILNRSTGTLTVNSSGGNLVKTMAAGSQMIVTCVSTSGTSASSWDASYSTSSVATSIAPTTSIATPTGHTGGMSANGSGTYTVPAGVLYFVLELQAPGGGGGGDAAGTAGSGVQSTFSVHGGSTIVQCNGGNGGTGAGTGNGGQGQDASVPGISGTIVPIYTIRGGSSQGTAAISGANTAGTVGGNSFFGGGARGNINGNGDTAVGPGAGGGGGGANGGGSGSGGGAGAYAKVIFLQPLSASYDYVVGSGGAGAGNTSHKGGDGAPGQLTITEYYQ